jgi:hypothetical protein
MHSTHLRACIHKSYTSCMTYYMRVCMHVYVHYSASFSGLTLLSLPALYARPPLPLIPLIGNQRSLMCALYFKTNVLDMLDRQYSVAAWILGRAKPSTCVDAACSSEAHHIKVPVYMHCSAVQVKRCCNACQSQLHLLPHFPPHHTTPLHSTPFTSMRDPVLTFQGW